MKDDVTRENRLVRLVRRNASVRVSVERLAVQRMVRSDFRPYFELRREPVLPTNREVHITTCHARTLAILVPEVLGTERKVVHRVWAVVEIGNGSQRAGPARQLRSVTADRQIGRVVRNESRGERRSAVGIDG